MKTDTQQQDGGAVASKEWLAANLKSNNGDILIDLERAESQCNQELRRYRAEITIAEDAIRHTRELLREAETRKANLRCRWNVWMGEHGDKLNAANSDYATP